MATTSASRRAGLLVAAGLLLGVLLWCGMDWYVALPADATASYVGRQTCARCHAEQVRQWTGSDHDRAMQRAAEETVLGDFNDAAFTRLGVTTRFFRRDGKFFVNAEGPDGVFRDYQIQYTFGVEPLQQYLVKLPGGRLQVLRVSWDTRRKRWFYVAPIDVPDERLEPGDPLHWTGIGQNWNTMCAECHSTNLQKNFDLASNSYHTTYAEIDVSCEACHGPGSLHVELAESHSLFWDRRLGYGLAKLKGGTSQRQIESCAPCHSRRSPIHPNYHAGEHFLDYYNPSLLEPGLYYPDGQILDEVYVYGSFLQSKMYGKGIRCTNCHRPHSLKLKFEGNRLCAQCHQPGKYDTPAHHHHTEGVATQCVTCHMPERTYMEIDDRRDHSLRVPRPDLSVELGTPNVCNRCHDKPAETAAWAAAAVRQWYGEKRPDDPHYARALAAAQRGEAEGQRLVSRLLRRRAAPAIVRATAVGLLAGYGNRDSETLCRESLSDASALVRAAAVRAISGASLGRFAAEVAGRLNDSVRLVRLAAVERLMVHAARLVPPEFRAAFERALVEYREAQATVNDRAAAHLNLAAMNEALGNNAAAMKSLRTAIRLEPYLAGARGELARLLEASGGDPQEVRQLREKEAELLARDARLLPKNAQVRYRRAMLLYLLEQYDAARQGLEEACRLAPDTFDYWLALALICEKQQRWQQALEALRQMQRLRPNDPATAGIYQRIERTRAAKEKNAKRAE